MIKKYQPVSAAPVEAVQFQGTIDSGVEIAQWLHRVSPDVAKLVVTTFHGHSPLVSLHVKDTLVLPQSWVVLGAGKEVHIKSSSRFWEDYTDPEKPNPEGCQHWYNSAVFGNIRCEMPLGHKGRHSGAGYTWTDGDSARCGAQSTDGHVCARRKGHATVHASPGIRATWLDDVPPNVGCGHVSPAGNVCTRPSGHTAFHANDICQWVDEPIQCPVLLPQSGRDPYVCVLGSHTGWHKAKDGTEWYNGVKVGKCDAWTVVTVNNNGLLTPIRLHCENSVKGTSHYAMLAGTRIGWVS